MAVYGGKQSVVATTTAASVTDVVVLSGAGYSVKVTNLSGGAPLFWTADSQGGAGVVPTINGVDTFCCGSVGSGGAINTRAGDFQFGAVVQLVSQTPTQYMVELQSIRATS